MVPIIALLTGVLDSVSANALSDDPATIRVEYDAAKVVYDVTSQEPDKIKNILDRISMLQNLYGADPFDASIIVVIHDAAIPYFVKQGRGKYAELIARARSLTMGDVIKFRMCSASAKMQGYKSEDIYDFIVMVPMADAEIVKLQHTGYALMH